MKVDGTLGFGFSFVGLVFLSLAGMIGRGMGGRGRTVESWPGVVEVDTVELEGLLVFERAVVVVKVLVDVEGATVAVELVFEGAAVIVEVLVEVEGATVAVELLVFLATGPLDLGLVLVLEGGVV